MKKNVSCSLSWVSNGDDDKLPLYSIWVVSKQMRGMNLFYFRVKIRSPICNLNILTPWRVKNKWKILEQSSNANVKNDVLYWHIIDFFFLTFCEYFFHMINSSIEKFVKSHVGTALYETPKYELDICLLQLRNNFDRI